MFRRRYFVFTISVIFILNACGGGASDSRTTEATGTPAVTRAAFGAEQSSLAPTPGSIYAIEVVKTLTPSVVQIVTERMAMGTINQPGPRMGVGTGVILDLQGNILTNNHVIAGAERITVTLNNGESFLAQVIGGDASSDTAVIRIEATGLQPAKLGRSSELQVGEEVIGIGHALGLPGGPTVSKGVVSALGRSIAISPQITMVDLIQTDAAINPGNSGGPLANSRAEVIGINTAIIEGSRGIGFAINIDDAKIVIAELLERGYVNRGFLGISPVTLPRALANQTGAPVTEGVLIVQVTPGSAADNAGLQEEDIIVRLNNVPIRNTGELSRFLIAHSPGETVTAVFFRGSEEKSARITLGERPR